MAYLYSPGTNGKNGFGGCNPHQHQDCSDNKAHQQEQHHNNIADVLPFSIKEWTDLDVYQWALANDRGDEYAKVLLDQKVNGTALMEMTYDKMVHHPFNLPAGIASNLFQELGQLRSSRTMGFWQRIFLMMNWDYGNSFDKYSFQSFNYSKVEETTPLLNLEDD